jgi:hypothetical protein
MDMTSEVKPVAEATQPSAEAQPAVDTSKDAEYWKAEAKKAFEARDSAKEEARQLQARQQAAPVVTPAPPEENLNELYWQKPAEVMERLVEKHVAPFFDERYENQKAAVRAENPGSEKYFAQVDAMIKAQPALKNKTGIVKQLVKVASAMEFDPDAERKRIEEKVRAEMAGKVITSVEGGGSAPATTPTSLPDLSADEKKAAEKFHKDLSPNEAHKKYAESKLKFEQRSI